MPELRDAPARVHSMSVVIPVHRGETSLPSVVSELEHLTHPLTTTGGHEFQVAEVLLVYDHGPDRSDDVVRTLAATHPFVRPVWLSRNFGQHAATLAGMASAGGDWIVTMDEDGQHDPAFIGRMLDIALAERASLVYGEPAVPPPHGWARNAASRSVKWLFGTFLAGGAVRSFQSYRLILGVLGRSVAAYAGSGAYLDVALGWVTDQVAVAPVVPRSNGARPSGYSWRRLLSHFWRLVISSGTRVLRAVSMLGVLVAVVGLLLAVVVVVARLTNEITVEGWASVMVVLLVGTGVVLVTLGVVAEYVGAAVNMAMGKPPYLIVDDPRDGPLGGTDTGS